MTSWQKFKDFLWGSEICGHEESHLITIADLIDKEGAFVRAVYCTACEEYRSKYVKGENWTSEAFSALKEKQYQTYLSLETPKRHFK